MTRGSIAAISPQTEPSVRRIGVGKGAYWAFSSSSSSEDEISLTQLRKKSLNRNTEQIYTQTLESGFRVALNISNVVYTIQVLWHDTHTNGTVNVMRAEYKGIM